MVKELDQLALLDMCLKRDKWKNCAELLAKALDDLLTNPTDSQRQDKGNKAIDKYVELNLKD